MFDWFCHIRTLAIELYTVVFTSSETTFATLVRQDPKGAESGEIVGMV